jgi:hypothetical protein
LGGPNPDRIPLMHRRGGCETVGQMARQGWDVISRCQDCGLMLRVNLAVIAKVKGPGFSLWNRKARCRRIGCQGWTSFQARAPGMHYHEALDAPWPKGRRAEKG